MASSVIRPLRDPAMGRKVTVDIIGQPRRSIGAVEGAASAGESEDFELLQRPCFLRAAAVAAPIHCSAVHALGPADAGVPASVRE